MKRLLILVAVLMLAIPAFSQASPVAGAGASTILNNDSCDIGVTPAATLLLPYFEVDFNSNSTEAINTVFTITNTSSLPQVAHVTVWTDWSFPVLDFNIYLTGYDVQGINLWDVISRGVVPQTGIYVGADADGNPSIGSISDDDPLNDDNRGNLALQDLDTECNPAISGPIPGSLLTQVQRGLTGESYRFGNSGGCVVGGVHENAVGYITVDVARTCTVALPTQSTYYTSDIAFDNVLIGDYQRINPETIDGNFAAGNPMVHIRATPAGTTRTDVIPALDVTFPYTFYRRYTPRVGGVATKVDRRMPLPGIWAARYIEEDEGLGQDFETEYLIWREGVTGAPSCSQFLADDSLNPNFVRRNAFVPLTELVRFDESENPTTLAGGLCEFSPCPSDQFVSFPETGAFSSADRDYFPADFQGTDDLGGWTFMNLNHRNLDALTQSSGSQNWVVVQMTAEGRYGVNFDAAWLANGCTDNPGESQASDGTSDYTLGPVVDDPGAGLNPAP